MIKTKLTDSDLQKLDAARGFDLHIHLGNRRHQNTTGLPPSVADYNTAIHQGLLVGGYITPIGKDTKSSNN